MTDKVTLTNLATFPVNDISAAAAVNANNAAITTAINNTLSRDGTTPNQMSANLDMNSNRILNLPSPVNDSEPLRLQDLTDSVGLFRTQLTERTIFYVRKDGDDSNTGLENTAAGAFLTPQAAYEAVRDRYDFAGQEVVISVGPGTYSGAGGLSGAVVRGFSPLTGGGLSFEGDFTTPSNVVFDAAGGYGFYFSDYSGTISIGGFKFIDTVGTNFGASIRNNVAFIGVDHCDFGNVGSSNHLWSGQNGAVIAIFEASYTISGNARYHWFSEAGAIIDSELSTITLTGTPAFSGAFAATLGGGIIYGNGNTYTGSATGKKFDFSNSGVFFPDSFDLTTLPGNAAGIMDQSSSYFGLTGGTNSFTFSTLPTSATRGMLVTVTNSNTNTWGATIASSGANTVLGFYNGTNWTVAGK